MANHGGALLGDRAYHNPYTNVVVLSDSNLGQAINNAFKALPLKCVPQFMHEVTHHWCYESPVGLALSLLTMRAQRNACIVTDNQNLSKLGDLIKKDIGRVKLFNELLRPLAEGLALFAEHDLYIGDSDIISRPSLLMGAMFAGKDEAFKDYINLINPILIEARSSNAHVRRKADLLLQPFDCSDGGYLPGYLTIKNIHHYLLGICPKLTDSDLFLHYIKSHIYDDWRLVKIILDDSYSIYEFADTICEYIKNRFDLLVKKTTNKDILEFEKRGLLGQPVKFIFENSLLEFSHISYPTDSYDPSLEFIMLKEILVDLFHKEDKTDLSKLQSIFFNIFSLRPCITLGHSQFSALVTTANRLNIYSLHSHNRFEDLVLSTVAPDSLPVGWRGTVQAEYIFNTHQLGSYIIILNDRKILFEMNLGAHGANVPDYLVTFMLNWEDREKISNNLAIVLNDIFNDVDYDRNSSTLEKFVKEFRNEFFINLAFINCDLNKVESLRNDMKVDGLLKVIDQDLKLLFDIAAISLCSYRYNPSFVFPTRVWSRSNLENTYLSIKEKLYQKLGYNPIILIDSEKTIFLSII